MPNQTPLSRYLLGALALLMLAGAVPEATNWIREMGRGKAIAPRLVLGRGILPVEPIPPLPPLPDPYR